MNQEIHLNEPFGQNIYNIIREFDLRKNLEIGSWDGDGSTRCFVEAMRTLTGPKKLECIEIIPEKYKILCDRFPDDFIQCINQSSISYDDLVYKEFDQIWYSPFNKTRKQYTYDMVKSWFDRDIETIKQSSSYITSDTTEYDSVLIDGGEFTGYSEYLLLKDKVKIFFLDDVHQAFKCYRIYDELNKSVDWELLAENPNIRNGYAIFKKKGFYE